MDRYAAIVRRRAGKPALWAGACVWGAVACSAGVALAAGPKNSSSGSSYHPAPAHAGGFGGSAGGAPHIPGGMGGGAHIPGSMGGGAHVPGSMGGGAHIPGSMAGNAHVPTSMGGAAHVPTTGGAHTPSAVHHASSEAHGATHGAADAGHHSGEAAGGHEREAAGGHEREAAGGHEREAAGGHEREAAGGHGGGTRDEHHEGEHGGGHEPGHVATHTAHADPRVGGHAPLHTRGLEAAMGQHHEPRPFLHAPEHRDVARDRDFVAAHRGDFHTRAVRDFSARELRAWRAGLWRNEWHYGRRGWWWEVDGVWYGYEDPVFPYPLEVAPLTVYETDTVDGPDLTAVETVPDAQVAVAGAPPDQGPGEAPGAPGIPPLPPAPQGQYSCADPTGYFPGVGACAAPWDLLPASPADAPQ
jgi:hypothetical protein